MNPTHLLRRTNKDAAVNAAAQAEFSEKRRVWIPDPTHGFLPGYIKAQAFDDSLPDTVTEVVVASTGEVRKLAGYTLSPMNPPQFDGVEDIADLTHLNEAGVVYNLKMRYGTGDIYTYSGLFLISLNPYRSLSIYTPRHIAQYRKKRREENPPHIFAIAERAWQQIGDQRESQSILITGESGAGKTENTKKVIQYLAAIASTSSSPAESSSSALTRTQTLSKTPTSGLPRSSSYKGKESSEIDLHALSISQATPSLGILEQQILQANPILEAFGNAQTMRNNNSSRFGKFIRIFFSQTGGIEGANIDWYLLEKSRVTNRSEGERGFHVFYQLLKGAKEAGLKDKLLLGGGPENYDFLKKSRKQIDGVDDLSEWRLLRDALRVVGFTEPEQLDLFRIPALVLHIGNLHLTGSQSDQAHLPATSQPIAERICHLLGVPVSEFTKAVLQPKVRAGREWVTQARTKKQAEDELGALCKFMYERNFGRMVERINTALDRPSAKSLSIGVLDIAGFEIFEENSYEQLLINFTNEKLQQFFNFHMFTLEQEEYTREGIQWDYVNFGLDLQPTIELIESTQPIGILSCLDEECIMPKASDLTFTEKVQALWEKPKGSSPTHPGSSKFRPTRFGAGFIVKHYAGDVEYRTTGWLEKNKDPINDAVARLLATSQIPSIATLFSEYAEDALSSSTSGGGILKKVKRGAFRTVSQRHKEQLGQLMSQLSSTQPHFVRCIVPNSSKDPNRVDVNLVLDQLRCNGVLEGIRIARLGYPNRHSFAEFRNRYEVLTPPGVIPKGYMDGRKIVEKMAEGLELDNEFYKIGATKIFFKAGVLADLEERRDNLLTDLFKRFQSAARMRIARRRISKLINRAQAVMTIQRNARIYLKLRDWPWWSLFVKVRPLLAATRTDEELMRKRAELMLVKERAERDEVEKKRLEDLRVGLVAEKKKVEGELEGERRMGRDREVMLERSKGKEVELREKVKELEGDLDVLGAERESLIVALGVEQDKLRGLKTEFEGLLLQAGMLEKEGGDWRKREEELLRDGRDKAGVVAALEKEKGELKRVVEGLKRDLGVKDDGLKRAKARADLGVAELEKRLLLEKSKAESGNAQVASLNDEIRRIRSQLEEAQQQIKRHETALATKQKDIVNLEASKAETIKARELGEQAKAALQLKIDVLQQDLTARDRDRQADSSARSKLEKELDGLRTLMAAKSSEDVKRREADRSREAEMITLREQVAISQKALDDQREGFKTISSQLRVDVQSLQQNHAGTTRDLKVAHKALEEKEKELKRVEGLVAKAEEAKRGVESELKGVREQLTITEGKLRAVNQAKDDVEFELQQSRLDFNNLEDAVLVIEGEKAEWVRKMEHTSQQLIEESAKRQHFEQQVYDNQVELAQHRNTALAAERERAKAAGDIKARDDEIALLRSRENKTIVEHVHVLEQAKKMTDRQLVEQIRENSRLNTQMKSMETHRNRVVGDLEDMTRQFEMLKAGKSREARSARASLSHEDKDLGSKYEEERRKRLVADAKVEALERDLQDQRKKLSTNIASPNRNGAAETRLAIKTEELVRMETSYRNVQAQNAKLQAQIDALTKSTAKSTPFPQAPATPSRSEAARAEMLRGLQQSHDNLGRDMSDQLRKLDSAPLTPSRRHNSSFSNGHGKGLDSPDLVQAAKRTRQLETEINGLRQQLEDEREEKEFCYERIRDLQGLGEGEKRGPDGKPFPFEQAMFSHFRLKAKSLRSQLDHWLAMGDLNAQSHGAQGLTPSASGAPFTEDVQQLKKLLSQLDPETSPLRT